MLATLLLLAGVSGGFAVAHTNVLSAISAADLETSAIPAMLDVIDEHGRTGWACHPEQAAAAKHVHEASLPEATDQ